VAHLTSVHSAADPRIFRKECRSLARAGFDVTVIGAGLDSAVEEEIHIRSVRKDKSRLARMTRTAWRVYRCARSEQADIYHFHDPELIPFGLLLLIQGRRVIYDIHEDLPKDVLSKTYLPDWIRPLVSHAIRCFEDIASSRFSALVAVTPSIAHRFRSVNQRTIVVHNFPCADELMLRHKPIAWDQREDSVAYVGGIAVTRAIREMVSAMSLLPDGVRATLELAGPENLDSSNSAAIRAHPGWKRVRYHGFVSQSAAFELLYRAKAGLVLYHPEPNQVESLPQKIFEYMGAGLPVVASDFPLWRRIITESGCGIVVDPLDAREIAKAIEYVLLHPREAEEMGRRGQLAVADRFNWNTEAKKLVDLYRQIETEICAA